MILDGIPIRCLTLDKRIEQFEVLRERGESFGLTIDPFIAGDGKTLEESEYDLIDTNEFPPIYDHTTLYPTWKASCRPYNAWKCHKQMMVDALNRGYRFLWMMEDDVIIHDDFNEIISASESFILNTNWSALYIGWYSNGHLVDIGHKHVFRIIGGAGFHSVILREDLMEKLVKLDPYGPFDEMTAKFFLPLMYAYAIYPPPMTQSDGFSYIENGYLKKPDRNHK